MSETGVTDEVLMARFRERFDEDAFDEIVSRHYGGALAFARGVLGDEAAAKDAVQEALVRVVRKRRKYDPIRLFLPWFYRILRNVCVDAQRRRGRRAARMREFARTEAVTQASPQRAPWQDLLQELGAEDREVLVLRFVRSLPFAEIARLLDCSEDAAKKRGQRAIVRLRKLERADAWKQLIPARSGPPSGSGQPTSIGGLDLEAAHP